VFRRGFGHFLRTAASLQWREGAIDLGPDAAAWAGLPKRERETVLRLLAGFVVGERSVAAELEPFAASAADPDIAACFEAQAIDEARHARFFERALVEVAGTDAGDDTLRELVEPGLLELFERRLPATACALAADHEQLDAAVAFYHLLLEGVFFTAGQLALLELLDEDAPAPPGLRRGVELVLRDERWHIGFGASVLAHMGAREEAVGHLPDEGAAVLAAWGDAVPDQIGRHVLELHRRRLSAAGLGAAGGPGAPPRAYSDA
jgi:ribonucleoside-diphosphate reductase beta chain